MIKSIFQILKGIINFIQGIYNRILFYIFADNIASDVKIYGIISRSGRGKLEIQHGVRINSDSTTNPVGMSRKTMIYISNGAFVKIGKNVGISTSLIYAHKYITIEDNVLIGGGCQIMDTDFHSIKFEDRILNGDNAVNSKPITIKEGAFIGTSSIILKGVIIGEKSVIAAGSVVTKSVPPDQVWGGNPAKFIKNI